MEKLTYKQKPNSKENMKSLICFLKGHNFELIENVNIISYPEKFVLVDGKPVARAKYWGMTDYYIEMDRTKKAEVVGRKIRVLCKKCGSIIEKAF